MVCVIIFLIQVLIEWILFYLLLFFKLK